eukprot:CAMPEP_0114989370 /NCGR_PEP_ID=MMETSP0216-20121206/10159_1 /TAXON_ID=223996 /ORGANISM="Protocruzia adherens, Strain Boccale" /LENGTH=257 /DNA_ID=CAMNT_0002352339 /DNA_START=23 /DNA_END=796 /DNA_ORIENTATION=+
MDPKQGLKEEPNFFVIGAGLPRNGTLSMKYALEIIYKGKCYHGEELFTFSSTHANFWHDVHQNKLTDDEIKHWLTSRHYIAGVDTPFALHYHKFLQIFPNAKVILNIRDAKSWYQSVKATLIPLSNTVNTFPVNLLAPNQQKISHIPFTSPDGTTNPHSGVVGSTLLGEQPAIDFYNQWTDTVINTVPKDRLLIYNIMDGWEPLCEFLDVDVPEVAFPRVNDGRAMLVKIGRAKMLAWFVVVVVGMIVAFGLRVFLG